MKKPKVSWNEEKLDALNELYPTHSIAELSQKLGISNASIHSRIKRLNALSQKEYGIVIFEPKKSNGAALDMRWIHKVCSQSKNTQDETDKAA